VTDDEKFKQVADIASEYNCVLATGFEYFRERFPDIPPEQAATLAVSAFIGARDTVYPKQSYRNTGHHSRGSGGEKTYVGGNWDLEITDNQLYWLNKIRNGVTAHIFEGTKDTVKAKEATKDIFDGWWAKYSKDDLPEDPKNWTRGMASCIYDQAQREFPQIFPKKEGK